MFDVTRTYIKDMFIMHVKEMMVDDIKQLGLDMPDIDVHYHLYKDLKMLDIIFSTASDANLYKVSGKFSQEELIKKITKLMGPTFSDKIDEVNIMYKRKRSY